MGFEHVQRSWDMPDMQLGKVVMSRAKAITYDNLLLRDIDFVGAVDDEFTRRSKAKRASTEAGRGPRRCSRR